MKKYNFDKTQKECTKCKEMKALDQFGKMPSQSDGLQCWCKACKSAYAKRRKVALVIEPVEEKLCACCGENKASGEFTKNKSNADGLHSWCAECLSEYNRVRYHKMKTQAAAWRALQAENSSSV